MIIIILFYYQITTAIYVRENNKISPNWFSTGGGHVSSPSDSSKLQELQKEIRSLQEAAEQREKQLAELSASLEDARTKQTSLQQERDEAQEENADLLQNYSRLQASVTELQTRVQEQEGKALQKNQYEHEIQNLRNNLEGGVKVVCYTDFGLQDKLPSSRIASFSQLFRWNNFSSFFLAAEKEIERLKNISEASMNRSNAFRYNYICIFSAAYCSFIFTLRMSQRKRLRTSWS